MKRDSVKPIAGILILAVVCFASCANHKKAESPAKGLKDAFKDKFLIGVALNAFQIRGEDSLALEFAAQHFNSITAENEMKWERIHPQPNVYSFGIADSIVDFGMKNGMFIIGHCLVWHSQVPQWVFTDSLGKPLTRDALLQRLKDHIFAVVGRYKGRVKGWDVVNEAIGDDGTMRKSKWLEIIGEDYVQKAFEYAQEADPNAELYYNDYNIELKEKRAGVIKLIRSLQEKGVKVDAIGIQGHWHLDKPDLKEVDESFAAYDSLGCKVMITEFEVSVVPEPEGIIGADIAQRADYQEQMNPYKDSLPDSVQQLLATRYEDFFNLFLKNSSKITRVTFWGLHDGYSWKNNWPIFGRKNYPLLFDRNYMPKPAYDSVLEVAKKYAGTVTSDL
jgi:endo-1,4-beta-xylanase